MSITDELRKWGRATLMPSLLNPLLSIADRIDAEHERQLDVLYRDMSDAEWVRLPKDADGEYIHIGDVMAYADNTKPMEVVALVPPAVFLTEDGPRFADMCRHYHAPTVEDVMVEFATDWESAQDGEDKTAVLKEYATKLRLAEEDT